MCLHWTCPHCPGVNDKFPFHDNVHVYLSYFYQLNEKDHMKMMKIVYVLNCLIKLIFSSFDIVTDVIFYLTLLSEYFKVPFVVCEAAGRVPHVMLKPHLFCHRSGLGLER